MRGILASLAVIMIAGTALAFAPPGEPLGNESINYSYDELGRLVKVEHSGSVNNNVVANYAYDNASNRTTVNVTGAP